jgi:hypothetical protein
MINTVSRTLSDETLNRIIQIESAGRLNAKAPTSSALGLFQFLKGTWLDTVHKHRPDLFDGRTQAQVLALRTDPKIGIEIGARFTEDNARGLGAGYSDGDLYLAHFLGLGSARKFLHADLGASAEALAGPDAVRANRSILAGKTAGQVRAWALASMVNRWNKAGRVDWIARYYGAAKVVPAAPPPAEEPPVEHKSVPPDDDDAPDTPETPAQAPPVPPPADSAVLGDPELWHVQRRLKVMKYNPGGVDGKWGGMVAGAITGFINDRHLELSAPTSLDMFHAVQEDLKAEIGRAESEGYVRPVSAERANADPAKVEKTAPEIVPVKRNFFAAKWASIVTAITGIFNAAKEHVAAAWDFWTGHKDALPEDSWTYVGKITEFLGSVPAIVWFGLAAGALAFIAWNSHQGASAITKSVQTGERQ